MNQLVTYPPLILGEGDKGGEVDELLERAWGKDKKDEEEKPETAG